MMHVKRWILMILLGAACLLLLASCGSDEHSANTDTSNGPIGTNIHDTNAEAQKNTASDHDGFEDGQIYTEPPYILEEDDPLAAEIQAALAEKKPTLIWAEDCFVEERKEAKIWHYTLLISFLLLVGDIPFLYPGMEITAIRSSRQRWLAAQILAAMAAAVLWLLFLLACTVLVFSGHISFQNEWSIFLKALARSPGAIESVGMGLADAPTTHLFEGTSPYVRFGWLFLFQLLLLWSMALWSLAFNLWTRRSYGCMITVSFWVLRRVVKELAMTTQKDYSFLSPMSLVDLNQKTLTQERIIYIALFFLLQIAVLWILSAMRIKREDLSKAG